MTTKEKRELLIKAKKEQLEAENMEWVKSQVEKHMSRWEAKYPCPSEDDKGINAVFKWEELREKEEEKAENYYREKSIDNLEIEMEQYEFGLDEIEVERRF